MCTILALHGVHAEFPLVIAANRDEYYARATEGPRVLSESPRVVGGRDPTGGGTWLGATEGGLFVGLTNQRTYQRSDSSKRSRGEVVLRCLQQGTCEGALSVVRALDAGEYNPFNLLVGDGTRLAVVYARPEGVTVEPLDHGVHVLANDRMGSPAFPKEGRARELARGLSELPWEALSPALARALSDHEKPSLRAVPKPPPGSLLPRVMLRELQALCIHTPIYGTRSATIVTVEPGRTVRYLHAPGAPCRSPFTDHAGLFARG